MSDVTAEVPVLSREDRKETCTEELGLEPGLPEAGPHEIASTERDNHRMFSDRMRRFGALVGTLMVASGAMATEAGAAGKKPSKRCGPKNQITLRLVDTKKVNKQDENVFRVVAKTCRKKKSKRLKNVTIKAIGPENGQLKKRKVKKFTPKKKVRMQIGVKPPEELASPSYPGELEQVIILKALSNRNKRIGQSVWRLKYNPETKKFEREEVPQASTDAAQGTKLPETQPCTPGPNHFVGVQDDNQFVFQQDISRERAFDLAVEAFGATALRINLIYGAVQKYGWQPYIDTVREAQRRGFTVLVTIMPTPSYMGQDTYDHGFGFQNPDAAVASAFAAQAVAQLGPSVTTYEIYNEPNHPYFSSFPSNPAQYASIYMPMRQAVKSMNPNAKVIGPGLAPARNLEMWIEQMNKLENEGVSLHPYGGFIYRLAELKLLAKTQLVLSEYGNFANDPQQAEKNRAAIEAAHCVDAPIVMYQLISQPGKPPGTWDTGIQKP